MKEFMLLIYREGDGRTNHSPEEVQQFLKKVQAYITDLMEKGKLKRAQPLLTEGKMISGVPGAFKDGPYNESKEIVVGYYHILAKDLDEAVEIAKGNPEFAFTKSTKIEVRPIKLMEDSISYVYPGGE